MSSTLQASVFMVKNFSDNLHSIKDTEDLTMKQMFDISAKLVSEQDEIYGVNTINWEILHGEKFISLSHTNVYVMSWKDESEPNIKYCLGTTVGLVQRFITIQNFGHN